MLRVKKSRGISDVQLRTLKCWKCIYCENEKDLRKMSFSKSLCSITGRWGSMNRAFFCLDFDMGNIKSDMTEYHGHRIRNRQAEDWRTKNQWNEAGYSVKPGEKPTLMFKDHFSAENNNERGLFGYYLPEQVKQSIKTKNYE